MLIVKVAGVHLVDATCWFSNIVEESLAGSCPLCGCVIPTWSLVAILPQKLNLFGLHVIVETDRPTQVVLIHPLCRYINQRV